MKKKKVIAKTTIIDNELPQIPLNQPLKIEEELKDKEIALRKRDKEVFIFGIIFTALILAASVFVIFVYYLQ